MINLAWPLLCSNLISTIYVQLFSLIKLELIVLSSIPVIILVNFIAFKSFLIKFMICRDWSCLSVLPRSLGKVDLILPPHSPTWVQCCQVSYGHIKECYQESNQLRAVTQLIRESTVTIVISATTLQISW